MTEIYVQEKQVVVPGEILAHGMECIPSQGTYRDGESIVALRLGIINISGKIFKIIPLAGVYEPKRGDVVIGKVTDVLLNGWRVDLGTTYSAILSLKEGTSDFIARGADLTKYFCIGDYVIASVINVTSQKLVDLSMRGPGLKKLTGGRLIKVNPHKVPRIIGKRGSMVSMIKAATDCKILVGQNGRIWINGEPEQEVVATETIKMIEDKTHIPGLTDKIKTHLEALTGKSLDNIEASQDDYIPHPGQQSQGYENSGGNGGYERRESHGGDRGYSQDRGFRPNNRYSQDRPSYNNRPRFDRNSNQPFQRNDNNQGSSEQAPKEFGSSDGNNENNNPQEQSSGFESDDKQDGQ